MCNGSVSVSSFLTKVGRLEEDVAECRTAKKKITNEAELERKGLTHKLKEKVSGSEKKWQRWDSNPRHRNDWCLKPAP